MKKESLQKLEGAHDGVVIADPDLFEGKVERLRELGMGSLHIVADFDRTLTSSTRADGGVNTSLSTLWLFMPEEYGRRAKELFDTYRPIEVDLHMDAATKTKHMETWVRAWQQNCIELGFSRDVVKKIAQSGLLLPRPGMDTFMRLARKHEVPVLIFSAGLGDLIAEYLKFHGVHSNNVHIISNFAKFGESGRCVGWDKDIVTSMTKNESHAHHEAWAGKVLKRPNVLLLGDHEGDVHMVDGEKHGVVLSVGYLNGEQGHLDRHKEIFDAVVTGDVGLDFPTSILKKASAVRR
ncbi:MAG: haloacid dehalogenase-like hydrolase [Candidatus Paceibacterota bacterium]